MKTFDAAQVRFFLFTLSLVSLTACSTTSIGAKKDTPNNDPETMLLTYHVKAGKEAEFQTVLARAWEIYREEHLVVARPHVVLRESEPSQKTRFVEVFTWVSHSVPPNAPAAVKAVWEQEQSLCEAREGHTGIEGGEVDLLAH